MEEQLLSFKPCVSTLALVSVDHLPPGPPTPPTPQACDEDQMEECILGGKGGKEAELTDDGHEGVEVADVEALAGHVDEELDDPGSVLLLHRLQEDMKVDQVDQVDQALYLSVMA